MFIVNFYVNFLMRRPLQWKDLDGNAGAGNVVVCRRYCVDKGAQNFFKFRPLFFKQAFFCIEII